VSITLIVLSNTVTTKCMQ